MSSLGDDLKITLCSLSLGDLALYVTAWKYYSHD